MLLCSCFCLPNSSLEINWTISEFQRRILPKPTRKSRTKNKQKRPRRWVQRVGFKFDPADFCSGLARVGQCVKMDLESLMLETFQLSHWFKWKNGGKMVQWWAFPLILFFFFFFLSSYKNTNELYLATFTLCLVYFHFSELQCSLGL